MISPPRVPGLFITGTDTGVGKTVVAGAIAAWFRARHHTVAVSKPIATGCPRRREGLVSEDAEFLASCADTRHPLDLVCPQRYAEPLAPAVAAARAGQPVDWSEVDRSLRIMSGDADVLIVEGVGGILVPLDEGRLVLDMAAELNFPTVIVARPNLGTINHTLLTLHALRSRHVPVAGIVINRYPADTPGLAEETNPRAIEQFGRAPILAILPHDPTVTDPPRVLTPDLVAPLEPIDWPRLAGVQ